MNWIKYLVEANLYIAAFYLLYILLLRGDTHYQLSRVYLLVTSLLAFIIPLMQIGFLKPSETVEVFSAGNLVGTFQVVTNGAAAVPRWGLPDYALLCYSVIAAVFLIHLAVRLYFLAALFKKGSVKNGDGFRVIELHQGSVAFSFFNNLFIDDRLATSQTILYHEQVHIRQKHSWDILYLEILKIVNWCNPVVYLLIASVKELHEFIADEQTVAVANDNDSYADFLISNAYGITQNTLTNTFFNKNLLKRRIIMLYKKKSGKVAKFKYLLSLPLVLVLICVSTMAFTDKAYGVVNILAKAKENPQSEATKPSSSEDYENGRRPAGAETETRKSGIQMPPHKFAMDTTRVNGKLVYTAVEKSPAFPGGEEAFGRFLQKNIHYPAREKQNNVQGKVYLQFVIQPTGNVTDIVVVRTPNKALGDEALRVLKMSPKWAPGIQNGKKVAVQYTVPVNFTMERGGATTQKKEQTSMKGVKQSSGPVTENTVFSAVDKSPSFPGGDYAFGKFLQTNIHYPAADKEKNLQGKVYIQFIIEKDGNLSDIKVLRSPSDAMSAEALRVFKLSPKWVAGQQNGKAVRVEYTVPINFSLLDADKPAQPKSGRLNPSRTNLKQYDEWALGLNGVKLIKEGASGNMGSSKLIVINGEKYYMEGKASLGQHVVFTASQLTKYYTADDRFAIHKWGSEAAGGVIELNGKIGMAIEMD